MTLKPWDWLIFLVFGGLVFFHFLGFDGAAEGDAAEFFDGGNTLLLFILDFQDFSCMTCLDSFLQFYHMLPSHFRTSKAWGILAVKDRDGGWDRAVRIARKKLNGFVRANGIAFPVLVDRSGLFAGLAEKGSGVLLFDGTRKVLCRYDFPLTGEQLEEIFANLVE